MGYIDKTLMNGEHIIYKAKNHWIIFVVPATFILLGLIIFLYGDNNNQYKINFYKILGGFFLFIGIIRGINELIAYITNEFAITNKRVISKNGLIRRSSMEILLNKIEGIAVEQGIIGRIFNYGTIVSSGTGGHKDYFHIISNPLEFRKKVQEQIENL